MEVSGLVLGVIPLVATALEATRAWNRTSYGPDDLDDIKDYDRDISRKGADKPSSSIHFDDSRQVKAVVQTSSDAWDKHQINSVGPDRPPKAYRENFGILRKNLRNGLDLSGSLDQSHNDEKLIDWILQEEGALCHIYPERSDGAKESDPEPLPLPMFMYTWIAKGIIFPEFLDALHAFSGSSGLWNPGAVRPSAEHMQCCYVINFVLPEETEKVGLGRRYVPVSALVYARSWSQRNQFVLVLSKSNALRQIISEAINWSREEQHEMRVPPLLAVHAFLAHTSTKGWPTVLLNLEHKVRLWVGGWRPSKLRSHTVDIEKELDDVSSRLRVNVEAMALLESISSDAKPGLEVNSSLVRAKQGTGLDPPQMHDLKSLFLLFSSRAEMLKKRLSEAKAEDAKRLNTTILDGQLRALKAQVDTMDQQMKIAYLSRTMNRALGSTVMIFLPGIYVSTLFSTSFFDFSKGSLLVTNAFWLFWVIIIPLSLFCVGLLVYLTSSLRYRLRDIITHLIRSWRYG